MSGVHHATVFFSGRVQGVGFRYSALQVAKGYEVSGCVLNLPDGRVQLEAEGQPDEVRDFITDLHPAAEKHRRMMDPGHAGRKAPRGFETILSSHWSRGREHPR